MAKLDNPKHEAFALGLAKGLSQSKAYVQAGYNKNPAGASKLAQSPAVIARVEELKDEIAANVNRAMTNPSEETFGSLAEMGITMDWVAGSYKRIYEEALQAGQYAPANTAVANIQKLLELEGRGKGDDQTDGDSKIAISDVNTMLGKVKDLVEAAKGTEQPEIIDITPPDRVLEPKDLIVDNPE